MASGAPTAEQVRIDGKLRNINSLTRAELDEYTARGIEKVSRKVISHLKTKSLDDASLSQLGVLLGICVDKARLIRGASTSNVAVSGRTEAILRIQVLGSRLEQALHGRDGSSTMQLGTGDNGSCSAITPANESNEVLEAQVLDSDAEALQRVETVPTSVKRGRGRPRKARLPVPPLPPTDQP